MLPSFLKPYAVKTEDLIRIGPKSDGGYVVHKDTINLTKQIITCGLSDDWKFEKNFTKIKQPLLLKRMIIQLIKIFGIKDLKKT